jgi:hypothetical protein
MDQGGITMGLTVFLRNIGIALFDFFFGCSHEHCTRPFTVARRSYRVCLDCGAERPYSVATWSYVPLRELRQHQAPARTATILAFDAARRSREEPVLHGKAAA